MLSQHGNKVDIINGFKLQYQKELSDGSRWCCMKKTCQAYLKDTADKITDEHLINNHAAEALNIV